MDGKLSVVESYQCEFCDSRKCDLALFKIELEDIINDLKMAENNNAEKRVSVYPKNNWETHGCLEKRLMSDIEDCVLELTELNFPIKARKRKRGLEHTA